jgi:anti-sigma-K factor RskA
MAPGWIVQASASGAIRLAPLGSTPVAPGKSLQLWTKADGWKGPVSLGLVEPGKPLEIKQAALPAVQPNQLFEITLEPQDGSPIGRPTGPILYIGRAVQLL